MKRTAVPDLVMAVVQGRTRIRQQRGEARLALNQRPHTQIFAVEVQNIEQEEDERGGIAAVGCRLDHAERGDIQRRPHRRKVSVKLIFMFSHCKY